MKYESVNRGIWEVSEGMPEGLNTKLTLSYNLSMQNIFITRHLKTQQKSISRSLLPAKLEQQGLNFSSH